MRLSVMRVRLSVIRVRFSVVCNINPGLHWVMLARAPLLLTDTHPHGLGQEYFQNGMRRWNEFLRSAGPQSWSKIARSTTSSNKLSDGIGDSKMLLLSLGARLDDV